MNKEKNDNLNQDIYFATGNKIKFLELKEALSKKNISISMCNLEVDEIKSNSIEKIVENKAKRYFEIIGKPIICTDGGIFIDCLSGFPGENSKFVAQKLGAVGILKLLDGQTNRTAWRRCATCYYDGTDIKIITSEIKCVIANELKKVKYPSYELDKILIPIHPKNINKLTYSEIPIKKRAIFIEIPSPVEFLLEVIIKKTK